jgi:hypothetical protein
MSIQHEPKSEKFSLAKMARLDSGIAIALAAIECASPVRAHWRVRSPFPLWTKGTRVLCAEIRASIGSCVERYRACARTFFRVRCLDHFRGVAQW